MSIDELLQFYINHLSNQVMPFWVDNCIDRQFGGITNCISDDAVIKSTDKYLWSQGRALWTFSALYNDFDHDEKWLEIAELIADFIMKHGQTADGSWLYSLHRDGQPAMPPQSIYVDAFVMLGLTEYARATGNERAIELAKQTFERTTRLLDDHNNLPTEPHRIPQGYQSHGPSMIFALVYHDLGVLTGDKKILDRALELAEIVMTRHLKPEHQLLYEFLRPDGELVDSDTGKTFLPGHAIESMWFMERIYRHHNRTDRIDQAMQAIRWHLEKGWDDEFGGIFLACHSEGGRPDWHQGDVKVWWPHTEALFALLKAYEVTRQPWTLEWYWRVHDYSFRTFPNGKYGDWYHNLDRRGKQIPVVVKGLPLKDPFHLPRALIYGIITLRNLTQKKQE